MMSQKSVLFLLALGWWLLLPAGSTAQSFSPESLSDLITSLKSDPRGPYRDIRWFCPDGTLALPKERCTDPGGVQRARYKEGIVDLAQKEHLYLGQILATTDYADFWDEEYQQSRLKQYQLGKYLMAVNEGWILQRGQYYRGAFQAEDEQAWGQQFLSWLLSRDEVLKEHYFLVRQAVRDIPHTLDDNRTLRIRAVSKAISDAYPAFQDLRVKIHGQPEPSDIPAVRRFLDSHRQRMASKQREQMEQLLADMEIAFAPVDVQRLEGFLKQLPADATIREQLTTFFRQMEGETNSAAMLIGAAEQMWDIRQALQEVNGGKARLALFDLSLGLEEMVFRESANWSPNQLDQLLEKICYLGLSAAGSGFVESWEWNMIREYVNRPDGDQISLPDLQQHLERTRSVVEWGGNMTRAVYGETVEQYQSFEPLAYGFLDDRIRASTLLPMGQAVARLDDFIAERGNLKNRLAGVNNPAAVRGINPGYARGKLVVVTGSPEEVEVTGSHIYVFNRPPSDLKPVAGITTVSEGNMVSHVQLLARNLGIPNAVISSDNMSDLKALDGQDIFYAVSNRGTVLLKKAQEMTAEEKALFATKTRDEHRVRVPVDKIQLDQRNVLNMRSVQADASGRVCGPKAANLGQLKAMFPEQVVEGVVIPFGIFRMHLDQPMPGQEVSYWEYLQSVFAQAENMRKNGRGEDDIESFMLTKLGILRSAIKEITLLPAFQEDFRQQWVEAFGKPLGEVPVFLRSDTNMEDLKEFTGAGLNLTVFNVVETEKIFQGIRDVWASPYTERSYKWRQKYLLNPENVFPSILVIPSVDVDYSGVMITKGITSGEEADMTIAFSRGAGGAVDGQAAETYLSTADQTLVLLSPAREGLYNRLPVTGGTQRQTASFHQPILNDENIYDLRVIAQEIRQKLPDAPGIETKGPFDIELGFQDDKMWLFQVRPFVENKKAVSSTYLESITPALPTQTIPLDTRLDRNPG
jgi:hypothetical protein